MSKKLKISEEKLCALVEKASLKAVLTAKDYNQSSDVKEPVSIAAREAAGRAVEANRMKFEQAEMQKVLSCLEKLNGEVKRLKKDNQKLVKTVEALEKSDKKQARELEYTGDYLADLKQDVRTLNGCVKKLKNQAKESKKILQIFGAIMQYSKPSDDLKTIRKKFTDALLIYKTKCKPEKALPYDVTSLDVFK